MTKIEYLLTCLAEECAEVTQRATKALRFGLDEIQAGQAQTNAERLVYELIDLTAIVSMLEREAAIATPANAEDMFKAKEAKVEKYLTYARRLGTVTEAA